MLPISDILIRSISGYVFIIPVLILYFFIRKKIGTKTKYFSYYRCVCFLLLFIWNFNCNRYWLYKHNIISSPNFYNSILWYDKWTNRYHTKPCFICSFGLFLTITV